MKPRIRFSTQIRALALITLLIGSTGLAQTGSIDLDRMERDISIMEGVLQKLLRGQSSFNGETRGLYVKDYGVIFHVKKTGGIAWSIVAPDNLVPLNTRMLDELKVKVRERTGERAKADVPQPATEPEEYEEAEELADLAEELTVGVDLVADEEEIEEMRRKNLDDIKKKIQTFYKNYAPAIGQIKSDGRIVVLVNLRNFDLTGSKSPILSSWIMKSDLDQYRRHTLSEDEFLNKMHFQTKPSDEDIASDVEIMSEIIQRSLEMPGYFVSGSNNGIYIDGLGSLFFIQTPRALIVSDSDDHQFTIAFDQYRKSLGYVYGNRRGEKTDEKDEGERKRERLTVEQQLEKVKDELFEIMASYGHTMRIRPQERVIFHVNTGTPFLYAGRRKTEIPSQFMLQLRKKDLDDYNSGALSRDALERRLISQSF
jgi:hypothetical protein